MIAEAGLAALWLAAALCALQLALVAIGMKEGRGDLIAAVRPVAMVQGLLAAASFLILIWLFVRSDMSVELVVANSHSAKPLMYRIAGAWGNHEGSMLMWVTVLAIAGACIAAFERQLTSAMHAATMGAQAFIGLGFYAFLLFASNPFARLSPPAPEGLGLNPLLQDPGLAFHPPTLYIGYVGLSIAFSFAVGALVTGEVGPKFARAMRPWVLIAWIFLTIGITAGSYWAYYELGWGGWWFWDPVENASLMPWLAATALLHSVSVLATRDGLRAWTLMLAVVAFSMSMVGTFLVRSGILTSVHAFAVDPTRGTFILVLLALYIGGALALYGSRVAHVRSGAPFDPVSREGALVANNLLLSVILAIVLIGTLYPLIADGLFSEQLSVGPPYFNATAGPIALLLVAIMAAGPLLRWRSDRLGALGARLRFAVIAGATMALALVILGAEAGVMPFIGLVLAAGVAVASLAPLWGRNLKRTPLFTWGMVIAHLGIAVSLAGMSANAAFTKETLAAARFGDVLEVGPFRVKFMGVRPVAGPNWSALEAELRAVRGGAPMRLLPQARFFASPPTNTNEAAIRTLWDGQLYAVMGARDDDRWQIRLWWKPFVTLIWLGGALIALGGLLSLVGRWRRERAAALRESWL
ncbi:heme lyase CcmF/NrfE family subunit [Sphingomonas gilva]|uniref:Heme lyase CcmF/NrfE family subunit n=1 Tax=Sphingomonas gilva TaxID=2305907 RepID=A0A396RLJ9_9SPHN|nr:heme lyase CcmF/NrfE family subunit [Sphingomonas gilva]RHW17059.1 heme lyase CcmF/NrfE family subunit [Sphingomonas gilva]